MYDWVGWHNSFTARKQGHSCLLWSPLKAAKEASFNTRESGCQQAYSTQHRAPLFDLLLQTHGTFSRLSSWWRILDSTTQPHLNSAIIFPPYHRFYVHTSWKTICSSKLIFWTEIVVVLYKWCCIRCSGNGKAINISFCGNNTAVLTVIHGAFFKSETKTARWDEIWRSILYHIDTTALAERFIYTATFLATAVLESI